MKYILILLLPLFVTASFGQIIYIKVGAGAVSAITAIPNSTSNPFDDAFFKDFQGQTWRISIDSSGELIAQKWPVVVSGMVNTEYITYKTLYFASFTPNTTGGFTTGGVSTTYESLKGFNGSGSATFKYNPANPNLAGTKIGVSINAGTQVISMEYVYEAGTPKFKFFTNTSYGSLAEITGATVDITKFYRWVRIGNTVGIYSDVLETGTFATLVRAFPEAYSGINTFISGYIERAGDGILFGRFRSLNAIATR